MAGHDAALRPDHVDRGPSEVIDNLQRAYLADAEGDHRRALRQAIADWVEAATLVSRGFARWGRATTRAHRSQ